MYDVEMIQSLVIAGLIITWISCACFSAWLAAIKGRSVGGWFFLGLIFGFIAFLAVGMSPKYDPHTEEVDPGRNRSR